MIKALKVFGVALLLLVFVVGMFFAQATFRFDLVFNPVVAQIKTGSSAWGEMVELTPKPLSVGEAKVDVVAKLTRGGFDRVPDEQVWARYENEINNGYELYLREGDTWFCAIKYYSFAKFNDDGRLQAAKGTVHEHGCL